jgi:ribosomal protein L37AE/L43A
MARRCTICDADDIQGRQLVIRGKRAGAAYCHACGRRLNGRTTAAVWICGACAILLLAALLMIYGLR